MLPNLLHVQNYWPGQRPLRQTWSLAVEEHFYLALPLFLWMAVALRKSQNPYGRPRQPTDVVDRLPAAPFCAVTIMIVCLALRCLLAARTPFALWGNAHATHIRADSLMFGVLLAYWYHFSPSAMATLGRHRANLFAAGLTLLVATGLLYRFDWFAEVFSYVLLYLGFGSLLVAMLYVQPGIGVSGRMLVSWPSRCVGWIGTHSYPIYIWMAVFALRPAEALFRRLPHLDPSLSWFSSMFLYVLLAIAAGAIGGRIVDGPMLALRDRIFPARATAL